MDGLSLNTQPANFVKCPNNFGFMFVKRQNGQSSIEEPVRCKFISGKEAIHLINRHWGNYARIRLELMDRSVNPLFRSEEWFYTFVDIEGSPQGSVYMHPASTGLFIHEIIKAPWSLSRYERKKFSIPENAYRYKVIGLGAASLALACIEYISKKRSPENQKAIFIATIKIPMEWSSVLRPRKLIPDEFLDFFSYSDFEGYCGIAHSNNIFHIEGPDNLYNKDFLPDTREVVYYLTFPGNFPDVYLDEYCEFLKEFETTFI